ncbi:MAG: DJ-1/PfpI family protein [Nitrospinales bacterium]
MSSVKNILVVIPNNQFNDDELFGVTKFFTDEGIKQVVLSKSGHEALGMSRNRFQPDGPIIDWNKQDGVYGKYGAIILIGGKGARKSLWDDPIIPQILVDHHRSGSIVGALGSACVVLARASLLTDDCVTPDDDQSLKELKELGIYCSENMIEESDGIITGRGAEAAGDFAVRVVELLKENSS